MPGAGTQIRPLFEEFKSKLKKRAVKVPVGYQKAMCNNATSFPKLHHSAISKNLKLLPFNRLETQKSGLEDNNPENTKKGSFPQAFNLEQVSS